jgi:hypothetical protein
MTNQTNGAACDEQTAVCQRETALGVHWLGGRPYMLTSQPTQQMRAAGRNERQTNESALNPDKRAD